MHAYKLHSPLSSEGELGCFQYHKKYITITIWLVQLHKHQNKMELVFSVCV